MKDLVLLVADKNMQATLRGVLARPQAMGIKAITFDIRVHPGETEAAGPQAHRSWLSNIDDSITRC